MSTFYEKFGNKKPMLDEMIAKYIDKPLQFYKPNEIILITTITLISLYFMRYVLQFFQKHGFVRGLGKALLTIAKHAPGASSIVEKENEKLLNMMKSMFQDKDDDTEKHIELPRDGIERKELYKILNKWQSIEENKWKPKDEKEHGGVSGVVYHGEQELGKIITDTYTKFYLANPLHPDTFPYVRKMEAEVVRCAISLFNGDETCVGTMTSGGTESIMNAMLSYREWGRQQGIERPQIICPSSSHSAHRKAAHFFDIEMTIIPVDKNTYQADVKAMKAAITNRTVALVASAPNFPHGVVDPIQELGEIAKSKGLGLHVDCCLGSFLLPCLKKIGQDIPDFDFSVPGVTSISCDPHKFGYSPKGCSIIMYRHKWLRKNQFFVETDWSGGVYFSPTMAGSRAGGLIAGCWAVMMSLGQNGYEQAARDILRGVKIFKNGLEKIKSLKMLGTPHASVIAFTSINNDIYKIAQALNEKFHWNLNMLQYPKAVHICVTKSNCKKMDQLLRCLELAIKEVKENPDDYKEGSAVVYGMAESLPDREMVATMVKQLGDALYEI